MSEQRIKELEAKVEALEAQLIELQQNEEVYSLFFNHASASIALIDPDTAKFILFNEKAYKTLGYTRKEFEDFTFANLDLRLSFEDIQYKIKHILSVESYAFETKHRCKNGDVKDVLVNVKALGLKGRKCLATIWYDITDIRRNQNLLKEKDLIFQKLLEYSPVYVFFKDHDIRTMYLSKNFEQMLGQPLSELIGKTMDDLFPSDLAKSMIEDDKRILYEGKLVQVDEELNGTYFTTIKFPIQRDNEPPILAGFTIDITERKKAEAKIRESEERIRALLEAMPDMIFVFDRDGKFVDFNSGLSSSLLMSPEFFIGKNISDVLPPYMVEITGENLKRVFATKEMQVYQYMLDIDGVVRHFEARLVPKGDNQALSIVRDITDRVKVEEELIEAKERAEESTRLKSAFLANMSHEIRTPMNGIVGFSEMFMEPNITPEQREYYAKIVIDSSNQLLGLVNDILDISRIEAGKVEVIQSEVSVNEILNDLQAFFQPMAKAKVIDIAAVKGLSDERSVIKTDNIRLRQILTNLINNAIKFTFIGRITFGYILEKNALKFSVQDTGMGIPADMLDKIFEPFRQVETEMTRMMGGTGLGLSISQKLVELLGGTMWVESSLKVGTTFYFTIPYNLVQTKPAKPIHMGNKLTINKPDTLILVAEDEDVNFMYINVILSAANAKIIRSRNGVEAVEFCRNNPDIQMVLMDIKMPQLNGYEATKQIKQFRPHLPIIAQTAYATSEDRRKAMEAGCDDYISKPLKRDLIISMINDYLDAVPE